MKTSKAISYSSFQCKDAIFFLYYNNNYTQCGVPHFFYLLSYDIMEATIS